MLSETLQPVSDQKLDFLQEPKFDFSTTLTQPDNSTESSVKLPDFIGNFDKWLNKPASIEAKSQPISFDWDRLQADRYVNSPYIKDLGFDPRRDNESRYGYTQTWGNTLSNAFVGAGKLAWNGFKDGWKGWGRMGEALGSWDFSKLAGDEESLTKLNDMQNKIMNDYAVYNTKESDDTFFNRKTFGNFLQQSGFTVGTLVQVATEQAISKAIEAAILVPTLGTGSAAIEAATDAKSAITTGNLFSKLFSVNRAFTQAKAAKELQEIGAGTIRATNLAEKIYKGVTNAIPLVADGREFINARNAGATFKTLAGIGIGGIKRGLSEANLALTESRMEAANTYGALYTKMYYDYIDKNGEAPSGSDLDAITKSANAAGMDNFKFNSVLLATMNRIQFDNVFKSFKVGKLLGSNEELAAQKILQVNGKIGDKEITQLYQKGLTGTIGQLGAISRTFGKRTAVKELGKSALRHLGKWEFTEGIQEVLQNTSNDYLSDYYYDQYSAQYDPSIHADKSKSFDFALGNEWNMQGFKTFMSGALMGFVTSGPSALVRRVAERIGSTKEQRQAVTEQKVETGKNLTEMNQFLSSPTAMLSEVIKNFKIQADGSVELSKATEDNDKFAYENMRTTLLGQMVAKSIRMNTHEALLDNIKALGEDMTKEEFEQAFEGIDFTDENKKNAKDYITKIYDSAKSYVDTYKKYHERFDNKINPDLFTPGSREHIDALFAKQSLNDAIERIAGNEHKALDAYNRMKAIFDDISSNKNLGASLATTFTVLGSEKHTASEIELLKGEIASYEGLDKKDSATQKLLDSKKATLKALQKWSENANASFETDADAEVGVKNMYEGFKEYISLKNAEQDNNRTINDVDLDDHFMSLNDYIMLNRKAQEHTDAFNMLVNPQVYSQMQWRNKQGAKNAAIRILIDTINQKMSMWGFSNKHKDLIDRVTKFRDIKGEWSEEQSQQYHDLLAEVQKAVSEYTNDEAKSYIAKLDVIISADKRFQDENRELYDSYLKSMAELVRVAATYGDKSDEFIDASAKYKAIRQELLTKADDYSSLNEREVDPNTPKKSIAIQVKDKNGNNREIIIEEGATYLTDKKPGTVIFKGKPVSVFNHDLITINSIDGDNLNIILNNDGDSFTISKDDLVEEGVIINLATLTNTERLYYRNRDKGIILNVNSKTGKFHSISGKHADKNYNFNSTKVNARLVLVKSDGENVLKIKYTNPITHKEETIDYDIKYLKKYGIGKFDLRGYPSEHEEETRKAEERRANNLLKQEEALNEAIKDIEAKLLKAGTEEESVNTQLNNLSNEIQELRDELTIVVDELEKNSKSRGRKSDYRKQLESLKESLPTKIAEKEALLQSLQIKKTSLQEALDAMNQLRDHYYTAIEQLDTTANPFDREGNATLATSAQTELANTQSNQTGKRLSDDRIDHLIEQTGNEIEQLSGQVESLKNYIDDLKDILSRIITLDEFLSIPDSITTKDGLRNYLRTKIGKTTDPVLRAQYQKIMKDYLRRGDKTQPDIIFYVNSLKASVSELSQLQDSLKGVNEKYQRLLQAKEDRIKIATIQDKIEYLNAVAKGIEDGINIIKSKNPVAAKTVIVKTKDPSTSKELSEFDSITSTQPIDTSNTSIFLIDSAKPPVSTVGFNKTAGKHFADINDTTVNSPQDGRFFKFSENWKPTDNVQLMVVTADNDTYGIRTEGFPDDVKLIAVKKVGYEYKPVGMDGEVLEAPNKDNIVYTSMVGTDVLLNGTDQAVLDYLKSDNSGFAVKGLTDIELLQKLKQFRANRKAVVDNVTKGLPVYLHINGKSNGIQNKEPKDSETGLPQELSLDGRLIEVDTKDWNNIKHPDGQGITLVVSTTANSTLSKKVKPGRIVMMKEDDSIYQVYNRKLNDTEKDTVIEALKQFSTLFGRKNITPERIEQIDKLPISDEQKTLLKTPLSRDEKQLHDNIVKYLMGVIFWSQVKDGNTVKGGQFYIKNGQLHKGIVNVSEAGGKKVTSYTEQVIPFTKEAIEANKDSLLDGLYHHVNNTLVSGKTNKEQPFVEYHVENGELVVTKEWSNYTHYLLGKRDNGISPVYTNIKPYDKKQSTDTPQLKNVYLIYDMPESADSKAVNKPTAPPKEVAPSNTQVRLSSDWKALPKIKDGEVTFITRRSNGTQGKLVTTWNGFRYIVKNVIDDSGNIKSITDEQKAAIEDLLKDNLDTIEGNLETDPAYSAAISYMDQRFPSFEVPGTTSVKTTPTKLNREGDILSAKPIQNNDSNQSSQIEPDSITTNKSMNEGLIPSGLSLADIGGSLLESVDSFTANDDSDARDEFARFANKDEFVREDVAAFEAWLQERLPQIHVEKMKQLIDGRNWGQFKNGIIHLFEEAETGTGFHEAFEAVWNSYLTPGEIDKLSKEFKNQKGSFTNPFTNQTKLYSEATPYDVREMLAEGFRDKMLHNPPTKEGGPLKNRFFRVLLDIINKIINLLRGKEGNIFESKIDQLYNKIDKGGYINATPVDTYDPNRSTNRAVYGTTVEFNQQLMEGMAAIFFKELHVTDGEDGKRLNIESLFTEDNDNDNSSLYKSLYKKTMDRVESIFKKGIVRYNTTLVQQGLSDEERKVKLGEYVMKYDPSYLKKLEILQDKDQEVKKEFNKYIKQFGLIVKDLDEIEEKEFNATDNLGIRNSIFVDPKNEVKSTVRLLIASLTMDEYKDGIITQKKNALGLPTLEDFDTKINLLLNELHSIVPVFKDGVKQNSLDLMFEKLDSKFQKEGKYLDKYLWLKRLKVRLGYEDATGVKKNPLTATEDQIRLRIGFENSFSNNKNLPVKLIVGEDNNIFSTDPIVSTNTAKIKETWENNLKSGIRALKSGEKLEDAPMIILDAESKITFNIESKELQNLFKVTQTVDKIQALRKIGFDFTMSNRELLENGLGSQIAKEFGGIADQLLKGNITTFDDLFGKQTVNGRINTLLAIEMLSNPETSSLSHQTASGKQQYSITLPSALSNIVNSLKVVGNLKDFVLSNPHLGTVNDKGEVILHPYQTNSSILKPGGLFFNEDGSKKKNIEYQFILGISTQSDTMGENTESLKYPDKIVQEIYHLLNGSYYTIINSDKGSEFALNFGHFLNFGDVSGSIERNTKLLNAYRNALQDEILSAIYEYKNPSHIQYYKDNVKSLGNFRNILGFIQQEDKIHKYSPLQKVFIKDVLPGKVTVSEFINRSDVNAQIIKYLNAQEQLHKKMLLDLDIIHSKTIADGITSYSTKALSKEQLEKLKIDPENIGETELLSLIDYLIFNRQLAVFEQHKLFYGHPALYKDLPKRANGVNSQKNSISENIEVLQWMDKGMERMDGKVRTEEETPALSFVSFKDNEIISKEYEALAKNLYDALIKDGVSKKEAEEMVGVHYNDQGELIKLNDKKGTAIRAYTKANEADAQAQIMPDFFRDLLFLSSKFTKKQSKLWDYEKAFEIVQRSNPKSIYFKKYEAAEIEAAQKIIKAGKPEGVLQVLKPQGFGHAVNPDLTQTVFLKNSVFPLTWSRVMNYPNMAAKYIHAQQNQVDIIGFESGQKVGNVYKDSGGNVVEDFVPLYDQDGKSGEVLPFVQKLPYRYFGLQVEMASYAKDQVIIGSQMKKLILANLPTELKGLGDELNQVYEKLMQMGKKQLLTQLGLTPVEDGYRADDLGILVDFLKQEAIDRDFPDNIIDALGIGKNGELLNKFDTILMSNIDPILNSIVDSRVISQKTFGKSSAQVSAALWEKGERSFMYLQNGIYKKVDDMSSLSEDEKKTVKITSSDLHFYTPEEPYMEVYLPHYFKGIATKNLDITKLDPRLLQLIGFRIPTQGMNSIENIRIKGFLDESYGDMVVVPSELVGKSGSDFDIDKLNMYLANYYIQDKQVIYIDPKLGEEELRRIAKESFIRYSKMPAEIHKIMGDIWGIDEPMEEFIDKFLMKAAQNRMREIMIQVTEHPDNFRQLIMPNGSATLESLAKDIRELKGLPDAENDLTKLSEWMAMSEIREKYLTGKKQVAIGAIQITSHALSQMGDVELTGTYKDDNGEEKNINIKFDHNTREGKYYISAIQGKDNKWISELMSEALTGFVDAAKNPFVFDLNITLQTASTWFYLQRLGVPVKELAYLHVQPLIEKYFKEQAKNESSVNKVNDDDLDKQLILYKAANEYIIKALGLKVDPFQVGLIAKQETEKTLAMGAYGPRYMFVKKIEFANLKKIINPQLTTIQDKYKGYTINQLRDNIRKQNQPGYILSKDDAEMQIALLMDYLDYQTQGKSLSNYVRGMGYDTKRTKNIKENLIQGSNYQKVLDDNFVTGESLNRVLNNTFIGEAKKQKEDIFKMFEDFFVTLHPNAQEAFDKVVRKISNPNVNMSDDKKIVVLNRFENFFINYLLHTTKIKMNDQEVSLNSRYNVFFGNNSIANQLKKYSADPAISGNKVFKELFPIINTDRNSTDNVKLFNNKLSTYRINSLTESLMELKQYAEQRGDVALLKFVQRVATLSILQSGVQLSPISFTKVLPLELYSMMVKPIMDKFVEKGYTVDADLIWKQFHQNNWNNKELVPRVKKYTINNTTGLLSLSASKNAENEYISTQKLKTGMGGKNNKIREQLRKEKKFNEIYDYFLWERIPIINADGEDTATKQTQIYYRPVNRLGKGMNMTEAYDTNKPSVLPENTPFDESLNDDAVLQVQENAQDIISDDDTNEQQTTVAPELGFEKGDCK